jgi:TRAP-type C4-dicarboxylate transport system permease small subunit
MIPRSGSGGAAWEAARKAIMALAGISGVSVFAMIGITVADVVLRAFRSGIPGAYDLVKAAGAVAIACSLPYVTALKGHIAIEFFYHNFGRRGRLALNILFRVVALALFGLLVWRNIDYGWALLRSGEVMPTLALPVFWIPWLMAACFALVFTATLYHLSHPGKEMIRP